MGMIKLLFLETIYKHLLSRPLSDVMRMANLLLFLLQSENIGTCAPVTMNNGAMVQRGGLGWPPTSGLMVPRDGHMSDTAAGSTEDDQSGVMKRHLGTKSSRLLLSKEEDLAEYIQENRLAYD